MESRVAAVLARIGRLAPREAEEHEASAVTVEGRAGPPAVYAPPVADEKHTHMREREIEETPVPVSAADSMAATAATIAGPVRAEAKKPEGLEKSEEELLRKETSPMPQYKSVRHALQRLGRT